MQITKENLHWAAGFIEGEGCFSLSGDYPIIVLGQSDEEHIDRLITIFGGNKYLRRLSLKNPKHKDCHLWQVGGKKAIDIMELLYPLLGKRRQARIDQIVEVWMSRVRYKYNGRPSKIKPNELAV